MDANRDAIDVVPAAEKGSEERDLLRSAELDFVLNRLDDSLHRSRKN
jgi:hypothetical protein